MTFFVLSDNKTFALNQHLGGRFSTTRHIKGAHVCPKNINRQGKENQENYLNDWGWKM